MSRSGFFISLSGPAAILTLLIHPALRDTADTLSTRAGLPVSTSAAPSIAIDTDRPLKLASIPGITSRNAVIPARAGRTASDKEMPRMRKPLQEGCERSISSLAGPEARRMMPGRCMT